MSANSQKQLIRVKKLDYKFSTQASPQKKCIGIQKIDLLSANTSFKVVLFRLKYFCFDQNIVFTCYKHY